MMNTRPRKVTVRVPATTANLGPGFDALGLALTLYNHFEVEPLPSGVEVELVPGENNLTFSADALPPAADNLVIKAAHTTWNALGLPPTGWRVRITANIPMGSGLGSSATAIVAGAVAANALAGHVLSTSELLHIAAGIEGHPDNVVPALLGGYTVVVSDESASDTDDGDITGTRANLDSTALTWQRFAVDHVEVVVAIPDMTISTARARQALPQSVPHADAVFNVGRASLLTAAMAAANTSALAAALADKLHEPYRKALVPGFDDVVRAARLRGALGAALSGAGPTVVAFIPKGANAEAVGAAMVAAFDDAGVSARWLALKPDNAGTVIE